MFFRYARHTTDLKRIEAFYTEIVGLQNLGGFQQHASYDGLFLGLSDLDWHIEFTRSAEPPKSHFDEDDALVFYVHSNEELQQKKAFFERYNCTILIPKNPYWQQHGIMIQDPDGFNIIFSIKHIHLTSTDWLTQLLQTQQIHTWSDAIEFIKNLPYGRNENRHDFSLVVKEGRGTCSSKHALLKIVADFNAITHVQLFVGIYKMNQVNTPKLANLLMENNVDYIPEAHCYLKIHNQVMDITSNGSSTYFFYNDLIKEIEILPEQVADFKVTFHKKFIKDWIEQNNIKLSLDEIWSLREKCIAKLSSAADFT